MGATINREETVLVRIKPHNPRRGYKLRKYLVYGMKYEEKAGWYKINKYMRQGGKTIDVGQYLSEVRNDSNDPESPLAFDVCTKEEASSIEAKEKKEKERKASAAQPRAADPVDLTTADVRHVVKDDDEAPAKRRAVRTAADE